MSKIYDLKNDNFYQEKELGQAGTIFLYNNRFGIFLLKLLISRPVFSKTFSVSQRTRLSKRQIKKFIVKNNIDMTQYQEQKYKNFSEFFRRKKKNLIFSQKSTDFCSPCDGKITAFEISRDLIVKIKGFDYDLSELIGQKNNQDYIGGQCLVIRLSVDDYHRYHFFDNSQYLETKSIKGKLHTVRNVALKKIKVFTTNHRVVSLLKTDNFNQVYYIEVGALIIGKIINHKLEGAKKGQEKGYFDYGGSTIVLLFKKNQLELNHKILEMSKQDIETKIYCGQTIGKKLKA